MLFKSITNYKSILSNGPQSLHHIVIDLVIENAVASVLFVIFNEPPHLLRHRERLAWSYAAQVAHVSVELLWSFNGVSSLFKYSLASPISPVKSSPSPFTILSADISTTSPFSPLPTRSLPEKLNFCVLTAFLFCALSMFERCPDAELAPPADRRLRSGRRLEPHRLVDGTVHLFEVTVALLNVHFVVFIGRKVRVSHPKMGDVPRHSLANASRDEKIECFLVVRSRNVVELEVVSAQEHLPRVTTRARHRFYFFSRPIVVALHHHRPHGVHVRDKAANKKAGSAHGQQKRRNRHERVVHFLAPSWPAERWFEGSSCCIRSKCCPGRYDLPCLRPGLLSEQRFHWTEALCSCPCKPERCRRSWILFFPAY